MNIIFEDSYKTSNFKLLFMFPKAFRFFYIPTFTTEWHTMTTTTIIYLDPVKYVNNLFSICKNYYHHHTIEKNNSGIWNTY